MPLYEWQCPCGHIWEEFFALKDLPKHVKCECGKFATQHFTPIALHGDTGTYANRRFPYYDESLDQTFTSLKQKNTYLKQNDLRIRERGEKFNPRKKTKIKDSNFKLIKAESDKEFHKKADEFVKEKIDKIRGY